MMPQSQPEKWEVRTIDGQRFVLNGEEVAHLRKAALGNQRLVFFPDMALNVVSISSMVRVEKVSNAARLPEPSQERIDEEDRARIERTAKIREKIKERIKTF